MGGRGRLVAGSAVVAMAWSLQVCPPARRTRNPTSPTSWWRTRGVGHRRCGVAVASVASEPGLIGSLESEAEFEAAVNGTAKELVVIKFFAPWCRACRGLEPKYKRLSVEYAAKGGVRFYELSHKTMAAQEGGSEFLQKHEINVLPLIHFYLGGQRVEAFPCGPRKIELLREKLEQWHRKPEGGAAVEAEAEAEPSLPSPEERPANLTSLTAEALSEEELRTAWSALEVGFERMSEAQMRGVLRAGRAATYEPGDVLVAEGDVGRRFFIVLGGECDVYQLEKTPSDNRLSGFSPNAARTAYGARTNVLRAGAFFGERSLVENAPRVASIVAATRVKALAVERSALADAGILETMGSRPWGYERADEPPPPPAATAPDGQRQRLLEPLSVMQRLRLVRIVVRAFDQAASRSPAWGDESEKAYRRRLVDQLTDQQRREFEQTFDLLDRNRDGAINLDELRNLMQAFGRSDLSNEHLTDMLNKANPEVEGNDVLQKTDFLALLAQAEFSAMFLETFRLLDPDGVGWLEAEQLWRVLDILVGRGDHIHDQGKLDALAERFGVDDGVIDYSAFVRILLTSPASLSFS